MGRNVVLDTLLIVPEAHTRLFRAPFQAALYHAFHRDWRCRWAHDVCTPLIVGATLALATAVWAPAGLVLVVALFAYYALLDGVVALVLAPLLAAMWYGGTLLVPHVGAPWLVAAIVGLSMVQAISHAFEPIPPPLSGSDAFRPLREVFSEGGPARVAKAAALFVTSYWMLETWAAMRVFPLQVQRGLYKAGYRPDRWQGVQTEARAYLATPAAWLERS